MTPPLPDQTTALIWRDSTREDYRFLHEGMTATLAGYLRGTNLWSEEQLAAHLEAMAKLRWRIVLQDGQAVAALTTVRKPGRRLYLQGIFVLPQYQNRGIGAAMLRELCAWAFKQRLTLYLHVFYGNERARHLYERLGFQIVDASAHGYTMELPLPSEEPVFPSRLFPRLGRRHL